MRKEKEDLNVQKLADDIKTAVRVTMAEEAPIIHDLANDIFGREYRSTLDLLDVYDKLHLILNNPEYYPTNVVPRIFDDMKNTSTTVNLTFKEKLDDDILEKSKKESFKRVVMETYIRLISLYTTFNAIDWLLKHDSHIDLASDFSTYNESLYKGKTIEDVLHEFYDEGELFNKLETFKDVNGLKTAAICRDFVKYNALEEMLLTIPQIVISLTEEKEVEPVNASKILASIKSHPLVYFIGQTYRYSRLAELALSSEDIGWKDMALHNILPNIERTEETRFTHFVYALTSSLLTKKETFEVILDFFIDENNINHKHDGDFMIPNSFDIKESMESGNYDSIQKIYEFIIEGIKKVNLYSSDLPEKFVEFGKVDDIRSGEGSDYKKFIIVSAIMTLLYTFKLFVQNSSYTKYVSNNDGMIEFISELEENFNKIKQTFKNANKEEPTVN